jgi:hypothetical protein
MAKQAGAGSPQYRYSPTADPNFVIRCAYNPDTQDYDKDCQRIPASSVPMGAKLWSKGGRPLAKSIQHPSSGRRYKLGRNRPVARCPRLSLRNYLTRILPEPPPSCDYTKSASSALSQVYGNDELGDCVIAGIAHLVGVLTGNAGSKPFLYTNKQIIALYSAIGGYVPGNPNTDHGCDEQAALNYWERNGAPQGAHQIAGWMSVDGTNPEEYRAALWLFENLYFGMELPDKWISPTPSASGFTWDVAGDPDPENGHCVVGVGYNSKGVTISTWGMTGLITDAAIDKYATVAGQGELYTIVSQDAINKATQKAPAGFDWSQLVADFDSMGGNVVAASSRGSSSRRGRHP